MKILIPILGFGRAGGYRVLSELANNWVKFGHDVDFLVNVSSDEPYFPTVAGVITIDAWGRVVNQKKKAMPNGLVNIISLGLAIHSISENYDVVLANHSLTAWSVSFGIQGNATGLYYIQAYEPEYYAFSKGVKAWVMQRMSSKSYAFDLAQVCNSPTYIGYKNVCAKEWIPPGVDFSIFYPNKLSKKLELSDKVIIGCIGRTEIDKGTIYVLKAFEKLAKISEKYHLCIAYGNLPNGWEHPRANIIVPANDLELGCFYRSVDIMIAPGIGQHGAPHYPVMEAMATKIPVVTTGYLPANEENAWIVPERNEDSIVTAVEEIVSMDEHSRLNKLKLASHAIKEFSWEKISADFIHFMESKVTRY